MHDQNVSRVENIIESRSRRERVIVGEYIAYFDLVMIAVMVFNVYVSAAW